MDYAPASTMILTHRYGSVPVQMTGAVELVPVLAAGADTGAVQLVPVRPDPELSGAAQRGVEAGFAEFMRAFAGGGRGRSPSSR